MEKVSLDDKIRRGYSDKRVEDGGGTLLNWGAAVPACRRWAAPLQLLGFRTVQVFFVEGFVLVVEGGGLALDEEVAHLGGELERIAVGDDDVGDFAAFERADLIRETEDLRGVQGHGL